MDGVSMGGLAALLFAAAWWDIRSHRIPNLLILVGAGLGMAFRFWSEGSGGVLVAIEGFGVGLLVLMPFYLLRALGAGDVKLMAAVGTFLGPLEVLGAVLGTFLAGGVMALLIAAQAGATRQLMGNLKLMLLGGMVDIGLGQVPHFGAGTKSVGKLPYAVAMGVGVAGWLIWRHAG